MLDLPNNSDFQVSYTLHVKIFVSKVIWLLLFGGGGSGEKGRVIVGVAWLGGGQWEQMTWFQPSR